jgi:hypothetical protein
VLNPKCWTRISVRDTSINSASGTRGSRALGSMAPLLVSVAERKTTSTAARVNWGSPQLHLLYLKIRKLFLGSILLPVYFLPPPSSAETYTYIYSKLFRFLSHQLIICLSKHFPPSSSLTLEITFPYISTYTILCLIRLLLVLAITLGVAAGITLLILIACFVCPGCLLHKKRRPGT